MSDVYQDRGYGSVAVEPGERPAIVVVDFQLAFTTDEFGMGGSALIRRGVANAGRLLDVARRLGVPVIQTVVAWHADGSDFGHWKIDRLREITLDSRAAEVDPAVADPRDALFVKKWPSAFAGTPVQSVLQVHRVDTVIVLGCTTSGCVRATIVDAFSNGYRVLVPEDGVGDQGSEPHEANLLDCGRRYCEITTTDDTIAYLERVAAPATA